MKHFYLILTLASLVGASVPVSAQISIDEVNAERRNVTFRDRLKSTSVDADYFSLARYKAERAAIRKERNYLELGGGLQGTLTSYNDPWISVSGGDNSIALWRPSTCGISSRRTSFPSKPSSMPSWVTTA